MNSTKTRRREFLFRSAAAAALLSPVLASRRAEAQAAQGAQIPPRVLFWVNCNGYSDADHFFPAEAGAAFSLPRILSAFEPLKGDMVVVDGIEIAQTGFDVSSNHVRSIGKVLTAKDILPTGLDDGEALPGGISIDQELATHFGWQSLELFVSDRDRASIRERPFALGERTFKTPMVDAWAGWDKVFGGFAGNADEAARQRRLRRKRSVLDGMLGDLARLRAEVRGAEALKLDTHEDAIRRTELSVQRDLDNAPAQCTIPAQPFPDQFIPNRCAAHLDVLFAAFACQRINVGGLVWGQSGYHWRYEWVPGVDVSASIHEEIHHLEIADRHALAAQWDWEQLANFALRLKATPEGTGNMLDNTLIVGISHFGRHHRVERLPVVLVGGAQGRLARGQCVKLPPTDNSKLHTTIAHLMGHPIDGFGDQPDCGVIPELLA